VFPQGDEIHHEPAAKGSAGTGSQPLTDPWGFDSPWAFGGFAPPTSRTPMGVAPPGGLHGRLGRGSRSPTPSYPPWRPAACPPRILETRRNAPFRWLPFRKGKRSRQPPGTLHAPPDPDLGKRPSGSGGWQRWGTVGGRFPPRDTQPLLPPLHRLEARKRPSGPARPRTAARASPVVRISSDVILPSRRLSYLARILEPRSRPFARRWKPSPLWDTASPPCRGTPSYGRHPYTGRTATHIPPRQKAHPTGQVQSAPLCPLWDAEGTHRTGSTS